MRAIAPWGRSLKFSFALAALLLFVGLQQSAAEEVTPKVRTITTFPIAPSGKCKEIRRILYDPCKDQVLLFDQARTAARQQNKAVLVSFGADWCIWCHVFDSYVGGGFDTFNHYSNGKKVRMSERASAQTAADAAALNRFVSDNFVLVHIASEDSNGHSVLKQSGAERYYEGAIPLIFAVDENGKYVGSIKSDRVEVRRDGRAPFRGYDRSRLKAGLTELRNRARKKAA